MRKNRLIALIGTLTMAAAGLAAISAGVSSKKADSVNAAVTNGKYRFNIFVADCNWLNDGVKTIIQYKNDVKIAAGLPSDFTASSKNANYAEIKLSGTTYYWATIEMDSRSNFETNYCHFARGNSTSDFWNAIYNWDSWTQFAANYYDNSVMITGNNWDFSRSGYGWYNKIATHTGLDHSTVKYELINLGSSPATPTAPTGYTFGGWYTDSACTIAWDKDNQHTDINLYAKYTAKTSSVTLDSQSGSGGDASVTATYGSAMPSITVPSKTGYTFGGYFTGTNGTGTQYYNADGSSAKNWDKADATITLYAHWTANTYTVALIDGATTFNTVTATYGQQMPTLASVPDHTNIGQQFTGFYTNNVGGDKYYNADGTSAKVYDKTEGAQLYAQYSYIDYTVTLDKQQGTGGTDTITGHYGKALPNVSSVPTRGDSYIFGGYYESAGGNGTKYINADGTSTGSLFNYATNKTIYAYWIEATKPTYTVTIAVNNSNYGSVSTSSVVVEEDTTYSTDGSTLTFNCEPSVSVTATANEPSTTQTFKFDSWSSTSGTITSNVTITANFEPSTRYYTLGWDYDGGSVKTEGSPAGNKYEYNDDITAPVLENEGFIHVGWNPEFNSKITSNVTYTAQWEAITPSVTVLTDSTGYGTVSASGKIGSYAYNSTIAADGYDLKVNGTVVSTATPKASGREGTYTFTGWEGIPASGKLTADTTITATFSLTPATYTLTWDFNGGSTSDTEYTVSGEYEYNTPIVAPTDASMSKEGFRFTGWSPNVASKVISTATYTAQWTRVDGYYIHVFGTNERYVKMSSNGGTEYVATIELAKDETFKVTNISSGSEGLWSGWSAVKYDTGDGQHVDARSTAQVVDDGTNDHNIKANLAGTNTYKVFYDTNESWIDNVGGYHTYIPSIVNVEFDLNGKTGTAPANQIGYARGHVTEPEDPTTTESYEFEGWYGEAACTNKWYFDENQLIYFSVDSSTHVATQKIYANWTSTASYNITLNNNGGTGGETSINDVHVGDEISVSSIPEKLNNTFTGYWTEGGTKVIDSDGSNETPYQESFGTTLNAGWTLNPGTYLWVKGDSAQDGARKMSLNGETGTQFVWKNITLAANDEIRCYYDNGNYGDINAITWSHPDYQGVKEGDNCKVLVAGTYDIYYDTTSGEMHLSMPSMPENGRYLVVNDDTSKDALHLMGEHQGYTGKEYVYQGYFQKDDIISAYYQDSTQATQYYPSLYESVKVWDYIENQGLKCPEAGTYSIYLISDDGGVSYNKISIFKEGEAEAVNFANTFLDKMDETCDLQEIDEKIVVNTKIEELQAAWLEMKTEFDKLPDTSKAYLTNATAVYDEESADKLGKFAASYDYIYGKYHASLGKVEGADYGGDFAQRNPKLIADSRLFSVSNVSTSTWIIASVAIVGIAAVGVFFIYRKRKEN